MFFFHWKIHVVWTDSFFFHWKIHSFERFVLGSTLRSLLRTQMATKSLITNYWLLNTKYELFKLNPFWHSGHFKSKFEQLSTFHAIANRLPFEKFEVIPSDYQTFWCLSSNRLQWKSPDYQNVSCFHIDYQIFHTYRLPIDLSFSNRLQNLIITSRSPKCHLIINRLPKLLMFSPITIWIQKFLKIITMSGQYHVIKTVRHS